ncbi:2666_t:CDS:2, partial [Gigaspora rosea]
RLSNYSMEKNDHPKYDLPLIAAISKGECDKSHSSLVEKTWHEEKTKRSKNEKRKSISSVTEDERLERAKKSKVRRYGISSAFNEVRNCLASTSHPCDGAKQEDVLKKDRFEEFSNTFNLQYQISNATFMISVVSYIKDQMLRENTMEESKKKKEELDCEISRLKKEKYDLIHELDDLKKEKEKGQLELLNYRISLSLGLNLIEFYDNSHSTNLTDLTETDVLHFSYM